MVGIVYWFIQNWPPSTFVTKQMLFKKKRSFKRKQYKKRNPLKGWFHKSFNPYITLSVQNNILLHRNGRAQNGWAKNFVFVKYLRKTFVVVPVEIKTITQLSCCPCVLQDESLARRCRFCETVNLVTNLHALMPRVFGKRLESWKLCPPPSLSFRFVISLLFLSSVLGFEPNTTTKPV